MQVKVDINEVVIQQIEEIESGEYNVTSCYFEFSDEFTNLTKVAVFTANNKTYKIQIENNKCLIPSEVLKTKQIVKLGVYGYKIEEDELKLRYSPSPSSFLVKEGSYVEEAENTKPLTPNAIEELQYNVEKLENTVKQNKQAITQLNSEQELQNTRTTTLEIDNETNKQDISEIKLEQETQNTKIQTLQQYNTVNKEKLQELENKNTEQDTNIKNNADNIEKLKERNAELEEENTLLKSQIPNGESEGAECITLNDSSNLPFEEFKVMGNSKQDGEATPEVPVEIKNVTDSANISVCNKNLCKVDMDNVLINSNAYSNFKIEGNSVICTGNSLFGFKVKVKPNTTYTRENLISGYTSGNVYLRVREHSKEPKVYFGDENFINQIDIAFNKNGEFSNTFTTGSMTTWVIVSLYADCAITVSDWALYEDSVAPENYIEHSSQQFIFPLSEGQKLYRDSYLADDGVHHKRVQTVLKGEENISTNNINTNTFKVSNMENAYSTNDNVYHGAFCSHFKEETRNKVYNGTVGFAMLGGSYNTAYICFGADSDINTIEKVKTYLAEQKSNGTPVIVEYELAEEIIEPYTEEQQIVYNEIKKATSYKNITHIFSTDEISPVFKVKYKKDLETMFNNMTNAIIELGGTINV